MIVEKIWKSKEQTFSKYKLQGLKKKVKFSDEMLKVLLLRDLDTKDKIDKFLNCSLDDFHDPFLLPDIGKFIARIKLAKERNEFVAIYGDYDTDGTISATVLTRAFKKIGINRIITLVPHRKLGYGLKENIIRGLHRKGVSLIVTCDCGSGDLERIQLANSLGMHVIVTDHHETIKDIEPFAFINPKRLDSKYPFRDLCGAGVVFKILQALSKYYPEIVPNRCLDCIAIATIADVCPLVDENRIIAKFGMQSLSKTNNVPLKALMDFLSLTGREITSEMIGFIIAPRLNAAGRISSANLTIKFLLSDDYEQAKKIFKKLDELNLKRREIEHSIKDDVMQKLEGQLENKVIVLASDKWHKGVIGIVASVIKEYYTRPTILFSLSEGKGYGSARNIEEFPLLEALGECKDLLLGYGGHKMAAGISIKQENVDAFRNKINEFADRVLDSSSLIPSSKFDLVVNEKQMTLDFARELEKLEPFGASNEVPKFVMENVVISDFTAKDKHLQLRLSKGKKTFNSPAFWMSEYQELIKDEIQEYDVLFEINENVYKDNVFLQLLIQDLQECKLVW